MTSAAVPIEKLSAEDVEAAVRQALSEELQLDRLADFLANVDWTNQDRASEAIRETLGALEHCTTEYAEHDLAEVDYRYRLIRLLPVPAAGD